MSTVTLSLLGPFLLEVNDRPVRLPTRKAESLLAYLVLHRGVHPRERIAAMFWGDSPDALARRSLEQASIRPDLPRRPLLPSPLQKLLVAQGVHALPVAGMVIARKLAAFD